MLQGSDFRNFVKNAPCDSFAIRGSAGFVELHKFYHITK